MEIRQVPLNELDLAGDGLAIRQSYDPAAIKKLSKNIQQYGLLVPLLVRPIPDGHYVVIDGNRRLLALRDMGDDPERLITCVSNEFMDKGEALSANIMREDMNPMDVYEVYAHLVASGTNEKGIAKAFGKTKKEISQILALARLHPVIKEDLRADKVSWETAQALTTVKDQERQLAIYTEAGDSEWRVREIINRASPNLAHALFDRDEYLKRGGTIIIDLFSEQQDNKPQLCEDKDLFWELQDAAIEDKIIKLLDEGWAAVIDTADEKVKWNGNWPWREQIKSKKQRKLHTIFYTVENDGEFTFNNRVRPIKEVEEKTKAERLEKKIEEAAEACEPLEVAGGKRMSLTLVEQLKHVRSVQVKVALAMNPNLAARVLLMMLINGEGGRRYHPAATDMFWSPIKPLPGSIEKQPIWRTQQAEYDELAKLAQGDVWSEILRESDPGVLDRLAYVATMAINAHYPGSSELINAILQREPVHPRSVWQPKAEFWKQTGRAFMLKILGEIVGSVAAERYKNEKVKDLAQKMETWFGKPDEISWMHFGGKDEPISDEVKEKLKMWAPAILAVPDKAMLLAQIFHHDGLREQELAEDVDDLPSAAEE